MLEQMRLQEGHLFQNESALALYLDAKAIVLEAIISCLRHENPTLEELAEFSDSTCEKYCKSLQALSPEGIQDYHAKSLHDCCKVVAKLLWPTQLLLTARPKIQTLLKGLCTRLVANDSVKSSAFLSLDPMLQDFVVREAFRRTIVNDCLVVFETEDAVLDSDALEAFNAQRSADGAEADFAADGAEADATADADDDVLPSDSASQIHSYRPHGAHSNLHSNLYKPRGASSVIGPDDGSVVQSIVPQSVVSEGPKGSVVGSTKGSVVGSVVPQSVQKSSDMLPPLRSTKSVVGSLVGSVVGSVAPRVTTAYGEKSIVSRSSAHSGITNTNFRKPFNVRTVQLIPE